MTNPEPSDVEKGAENAMPIAEPAKKQSPWKGVFRFNSHEEADAWTEKMLADQKARPQTQGKLEQ